jgi:restriction endonuclease S subunit
VQYSIIQKSQFEGALRLDAEYYQPEYLDLISKIKSQKSKNLSEIGEIVYGTTPTGGIFEESGIPFIRSKNFSNSLIDTSDLVFCSEKFHNQNKKSEVRPGDILFAAVGATIGDLAVAQDEIKTGNINQNIAKVRIIDKNINPYFTGLFFGSKYGQLQIERLITGNAQSYLNSEQIGSFFVPLLDIEKQNKIAKYFKEIQNEFKNSKIYYQQAENLLLEELGLSSFAEASEDKERFCIVNLSDVKKARRMDAEYFQLDWETIKKKIGKNVIKLGDLVDLQKGIEPGSEAYQEDGKLFIRVSNLSKQEIIDKDQKYLSEELYQKLKKDYEPKLGEILLTKDATPGIAYAVKEQIEGIISSGILRLKVKDKEIENEYLSLCLNSVVGQIQAERDGGGSIITHWKPEQIKNVLIPILLKPTQKRISELVRQSHESRRRAKLLLEGAKGKVEELVESKK